MVVAIRFVIIPLRCLNTGYSKSSIQDLHPLLLRLDEFGDLARLIRLSIQHKQELQAQINEKNTINQNLIKSQHHLQQLIQERDELYQNLHDGIIQSLYAQTLVLQGLLLQATKELETPLLELQNNLKSVMRELRMFIASGSKEEIQSCLVDDIKNMIETLRNPIVKFTYLGGDEGPLSFQQHLQLLFITRECLSNALKYSQATTIEISLEFTDTYVSLLCRDNGVGFDLNEKVTGYGLTNIKSRVKKFDGSITIQTNKGNGCTIHITLPF